MRCRKILNGLLAAALLVAISAGAAAGENGKAAASAVAGKYLVARLRCKDGVLSPVRGKSPEEEVLLRWHVEKWLPEQTGFVLFRRENTRGTTGPWMKIGEVRPGFSDQRLRELGLRGVIGRPYEIGGKKNPKSGELLELYAKNGEALARAQAESMRRPRLGRLLGFAFVCVVSLAGEQYQYVVVPKIRGREAKPEDAVVRCKMRVPKWFLTGPRLLEFRAARIDNQGRLRATWKVRRAEIEARPEIKGFAFFRSRYDLALDPKPCKKVDLKSALKQKTADEMTFECTFPVLIAQPIKLGLAAVDGEGRTGEVAGRKILPRLGRSLKAVSDVKFEFVKNYALISWKYSEDSRDFAGFHVYRLTADGKEKRVTHIPRHVSWRNAADYDVIRELGGREVSYRVEAVSGDYRKSPSAVSVNKQKVPYPPPGPPIDFKARLSAVGGKRGVTPKWDFQKQTPGTSRLQLEYLVLPGGKWQKGGSCAARAARFAELKGLPKDAHRILVRGYLENADGRKSSPGEEVLLVMPGKAKKPPAPEHDLVVEHHPAVTFFRWKGDSDGGWRILMDGKLLADEKKLVPYSNQWRTWELPAGEHVFALVRVSKDGGVSEARKTGKIKISYPKR